MKTGVDRRSTQIKTMVKLTEFLKKIDFMIPTNAYSPIVSLTILSEMKGGTSVLVL